MGFKGIAIDEKELATNKVCERCKKQHKEVIADGYVVGFLCFECFKFVYAID